MKKILIPIFATSILAFAGVKYCTPQSLGYELAQEILKSHPQEKKYVYDNLCVRAAKESIRMGYNLRISSVRLNCMKYITNKDKKPPKQVNPSYMIDRVKD